MSFCLSVAERLAGYTCSKCVLLVFIFKVLLLRACGVNSTVSVYIYMLLYIHMYMYIMLHVYVYAEELYLIHVELPLHLALILYAAALCRCTACAHKLYSGTVSCHVL